MKALVLIWSYANFYPSLTPFILFTVFLILSQILREQLEKVNSALIFFIAMGAVGFATYENFRQGPEVYAGFLKAKGQETDAFVKEVKKTKPLFSSTEVDEVVLSFNDDEDRVTYVAQARRFFPTVEEPFQTPEVRSKVRIAYYPGVESGFIILSDPGKSSFGSKLACGEQLRVLKLSENAFKFEQFPSAEKRAAYKNAIETALSLGCIESMSEREHYRDAFGRL